MAKLMGIEDVSTEYNTPVSTLRWWKAQGVGPKPAKIGRRVMYRCEDVEAWFNAKFDA